MPLRSPGQQRLLPCPPPRNPTKILIYLQNSKTLCELILQKIKTPCPQNPTTLLPRFPTPFRTPASQIPRASHNPPTRIAHVFVVIIWRLIAHYRANIADVCSTERQKRRIAQGPKKGLFSGSRPQMSLTFDRAHIGKPQKAPESRFFGGFWDLSGLSTLASDCSHKRHTKVCWMHIISSFLCQGS